jgi:hypothetical protein
MILNRLKRQISEDQEQGEITDDDVMSIDHIRCKALFRPTQAMASTPAAGVDCLGGRRHGPGQHAAWLISILTSSLRISGVGMTKPAQTPPPPPPPIDVSVAPGPSPSATSPGKGVAAGGGEHKEKTPPTAAGTAFSRCGTPLAPDLACALFGRRMRGRTFVRGASVCSCVCVDSVAMVDSL